MGEYYCECQQINGYHFNKQKIFEGPLQKNLNILVNVCLTYKSTQIFHRDILMVNVLLEYFSLLILL